MKIQVQHPTEEGKEMMLVYIPLDPELREEYEMKKRARNKKRRKRKFAEFMKREGERHKRMEEARTKAKEAAEAAEAEGVAGSKYHAQWFVSEAPLPSPQIFNTELD